MMKVVVIFSVVMMTCSEVSSRMVARCPDCEHLCSSRYSEECQYENYIDYCGCCEFCTGSANSVDKRGGLFQHKHNTRRVLRTDSTRRILRTDNTMRVLGTDNTRRVLRTDNNVKRIVCSPSYCESFTCEPIKECDGVIKKNGGFCECCDICMIQLDEGATCLDIHPLGFIPTSECGPSLHCDNGRCVSDTNRIQPLCLTVCNFAKCEPISHCDGKIIPKGTDCNCCDICESTHANDEDLCFVLMVHGAPTSHCKPGFICVNNMCEPVCELELKQRHKGFVGGPTINCDSDGTFAPTQCEGAFLGSECYCVMKDGSKIPNYAETDNTTDMNCKCARDKAEYEKTKMVGKMFSCSKNGNYEPIQCTGDVCYCADENGNQKGDNGVPIGDTDSLNC